MITYTCTILTLCSILSGTSLCSIVHRTRDTPSDSYTPLLIYTVSIDRTSNPWYTIIRPSSLPRYGLPLFLHLRLTDRTVSPTVRCRLTVSIYLLPQVSYLCHHSNRYCPTYTILSQGVPHVLSHTHRHTVHVHHMYRS